MTDAPIDPITIVAEHSPNAAGWCSGSHGQPAPFPVQHPCTMRQLADALQRVLDQVAEWEASSSRPIRSDLLDHELLHASQIRVAIERKP